MPPANTGRPSRVDPPTGRSPLAEALDWVSRITVIGLEMVVPGVLGQKLDQKWGTRYWGLLGFALGLTAAVYHLVAISKSTTNKRSASQDTEANAPSHTDEPPRDDSA